MGDKFVAQIRLGRQTCRPAMNFSVTKMQVENKIAQLVFFLNKTNFLSISKTLTFVSLGKKNLIIKKTAQFQSH
jgi:hypothetical protein